MAHRPFSFLFFLFAITICLFPLAAQEAPPQEGNDQPEQQPKGKNKGQATPQARRNAEPPETFGTVKELKNYHVDVVPANIGITPASQPPATEPEVFGEPRNSAGHPCTLVDKDDIAALKKSVTANDDAKAAFQRLKDKVDKRIKQDIGVPLAKKAADGTWMFPGDILGVKSPGDRTHKNSGDAADLGMAYQLTGDAKYAEYCKKMLLAYADNYNNWGHPKGWTPIKYHSAQDGRITGQFLEDGICLGELAVAYDLIHDLPGWTDQERAHLRDDFFRAIEVEFSEGTRGNYLGSEHNRSCICTAAVLMAGYSTDDEKMINDAFYGWNGSKEKPTGGLFKVHFGTCLLPDGTWIEGSPGYQTGIASCGLFDDAETLWHHGIDMYRYRNGVLKQLLNSAIHLANPNEKMNLPKLHDSEGGALVTDRAWSNNELGVPFECGYRRYHDARFLPMVYNATKEFSMTIHGGAFSLFLDKLPPKESAPPRVPENVNFYSVGYGFLRQQTGDGYNQLIMEFGPSAGHAHPSKLGIDLFALGETVAPFPGVIFPYNDPLDPAWFWTTVGNCILTVDQKDQLYSKNKFQDRGAEEPVAIQLVYAPASTMGMQRAWSNTIHPGVTEDRACFLTPNYCADIFGGFDTDPHTYDMAWHLRGTLSSGLKTDAYTFPAPVAEGYNSIEHLTHTSTDKGWDATATLASGKAVRLVAAGGTSTEVLFGTGHYMTDRQDENPPTILERRTGQPSALFGNALDISNSGFVKNVAQEGSLDAGYGLLKVTTPKGTDLCFTAFRPGSYTASGMTTDAQQAFVRMDGAKVDGMYLGGGTSLKAADGSIARTEPGLAFVEKTGEGNYIVGNPSPVETTITVTLPALSGLKAFNVDGTGKRGEAVTVTANAGSFKMKLKPQAKVEFAKG